MIKINQICRSQITFILNLIRLFSYDLSFIDHIKQRQPSIAVVLNLFKAATPFNYEFLFATHKTRQTLKKHEVLLTDL
jgi:hypothetical protein